MTIDVFWLVIIGLVLILVGVVIWELIDAIKKGTDRTYQTSLTAMDHMQSNYGNMMHKMADWHDQAIRAERAHTERVMEIATAPEAHVAITARQHGLERHEEQVTAAQHSTNERKADLMELAQRGHPVEEKPPERVPVERSKASRSRGILNEGRIPERHR